MTQIDYEYFAELLEIFRIGLLNQIIDRQKVIAWADELIEQEDEPAYFLIEISLCSKNHINDMISLLDKHTGENKPQVAGRVILGYLHHEYCAKCIPLQKVARTLYWLSLHSTLSGEEQDFMSQLDVDLELAVDGVCGTVAEVEEHILHFLTIYRGFNLDNKQQWNEINTLIPNKLQIFYRQAINW